MAKVSIPIKAVSTLNAREHWSVKAKRHKSQRQAAYLMTPKAQLPAVVTLTRCGPRTLDGDNLQGSLKAVRDGVADKLGVDDNSPLIDFKYAQAKSKDYAVEIEVKPAPTPPL
jgi:hypothetical protein